MKSTSAPLFLNTGILLITGFLVLLVLKRIAAVMIRKGENPVSLKRINRFIALLEPFFFLLLVFWFIHIVFSHYQKYLLVFYLAFAGIVTAGGWFFIRDIIAGIVLRGEENIKIGDHIQFNDFSGKIQHIGLRCLKLKKNEDTQVVIPYSTIAKAIVTKLSPTETIDPYTFTLNVPKTAGAPIYIEKIRQAALRIIWISLKKEPQILLLKEENDTFVFQVTVYPIVPEYGMKIEDNLKNEFQKG